VKSIIELVILMVIFQVVVDIAGKIEESRPGPQEDPVQYNPREGMN
jgi:hypothetical protein